MDWKKLIGDLVSTGVTQIEIGKAIGLSQPAISDLLRGRTSRVEWAVGESLIDLHRIKVGGVSNTAPESHQEAA